MYWVAMQNSRPKANDESGSGQEMDLIFVAQLFPFSLLSLIGCQQQLHLPFTVSG